MEFVSKYRISKNKLEPQIENMVPRIIPTYSSSPKGNTFGLYCKYQLLSYNPWKRTQADAWGNVEESDEVFINTWQDFLSTPSAQMHVPDWVDKVQDLSDLNES